MNFIQCLIFTKMNLEQLKNHHSYQFENILSFNGNIFVVDYSTISNQKGVEFLEEESSELPYFKVINSNSIPLNGIKYDEKCFKIKKGITLSQCEGVIFPKEPTENSFLLFVELKYDKNDIYNHKSIKKAISQLYRTRYYYCQTNTVSIKNTCYLFASLPNQNTPFTNFILTQDKLIKLKSTRNIILRLKNVAEIIDNQFIL